MADEGPLAATVEEREAALLAPYAMHSVESAGRVYSERSHPYRGPFQRDRDRIVHSSAFRRLAHKTQVFTGELSDYHRSRLTHTLEVASIARTIGRELRLNEDLIEALALMHDIGHPPFGHAGEAVLDECSRAVGGFNHNEHALRIATLLETRYPEFPGLNLTQEVLSGQQVRAEKHLSANELEPLSLHPLLEVQVVDAADNIAYDTHDADDALELGLLKLDDLVEVPLWQEAAREVRDRYPLLDTERFRRAVIHRLIEFLVSDLVEATKARLAGANVASVAAVRHHRERLVVVSPAIATQQKELEKFLYGRVYRHPNVLAERAVAERAVRELFVRYTAAPETLPTKFQARLAEDGVPRSICDYLASMTDRFALGQYRR
jgi:dGTPase